LFQCNIEECGQQFLTEARLNQHTLEAHTTEISISKPMENSGGNTRAALNAALASVGFTDDQVIPVKNLDGSCQWMCPYSDCELTFKTKYLMKNHLLKHYDIRPFKVISC